MRQRTEARYSVAAVSETLEMLSLLASDPPMSLAAITERVRTPKSTVLRRLRTLQAGGWVERREDGKYVPGLTLYSVGQRVASKIEIVEAARPVMKRIVQTCDETVNLVALDGDYVVYLAVEPCRHPLRMSTAVGDREVASVTACGRAILAHVPELSMRHGGEPWLRFARDHGYTQDDQECLPGARCVGAPVRDAAGKVRWGLSISGPATRLTLDRIPKLGHWIREAADEISSRLGYVSGAYSTASSR